MDDGSTPPPQLPPSETKMGGSTPPQLPPNFNDLQQAEPYWWNSTTKVRKEDGTIQLPPKFNLLQEVELMNSPPLGLKLTITPELVTKYWSWRLERWTGKPVGNPPENKGSVIPATSISIGPDFRKESKRVKDLTLKLSFAKKKLIWEFVEGRKLKEKIEVSWSDITAIDAHLISAIDPHILDHQPGLLRIQLGSKPSFFRKNPPQLHWIKTSDFTHAHAASHHRIYEAKFRLGVLDADYAKIMLSDQRLLELSMHPFPAYPNPTQQGESSGSSTAPAPCLQQQSLTTTHVNNPTSSTAAASQSLSRMQMQMQGESSSSRNADRDHETPLVLASYQNEPLAEELYHEYFNLVNVPANVEKLTDHSRRSMDDGTSTPPPQLPQSETQSRRMGGSSTSTPPQLLPSEAESRRSMGGSSTSTPPATKVVPREDGTIQLPPKFNLLQEVESMKSPPLGLKLTITPEFLAKLTRATAPAPAPAARGRVKQPPEKAGKATSASQIQATSISIGPNWRRESRREDDLTLKLYFARRKLIWEFLEGALKEKIEVSWSDITAIHAHLPDNQPGILQIKLGDNKPLFYRETPPKAMKHTDWKLTSDFTRGQAASRYRIHEAEFAQGVLDAHYLRLLQSDRRLLELSKNPFPPYLNPNPNPTQQQQGDSSTTAPCLSVNNPAPSNSTPPSQSHDHLNPIPPIPFTVGVGESSFHAKHQAPLLMPSTSSQQLPFSFTEVEQSLPFNMQGESAPYSTSSTAAWLQQQSLTAEGRFPSMSESSRNANQYQTPLLMPSMSSPFSFTGVEQSLQPYNNPTPSIPASQYLNPAMSTEELYQYIYQNNLSCINNVPAINVDQPTMEMGNIIAAHDDQAAPINRLATLDQGSYYNIDASGHEQWLALGSLNYEQWPELDG